MKRFRVSIVAMEKQLLYIFCIYSEYVSVASVIQHAMCMRRIILSPVVCLAVPYFTPLPHKRHDFRANVIEHKMCVLIVSANLSEIFLIRRRILRDAIINVYRSSYRGVDKSLARPGRKQANVSVRMA